MSHGLIRLQPESLTLSGLPIYVARIPAAPFPRAPFSFSLGLRMKLLLTVLALLSVGSVAADCPKAADWARAFYSENYSFYADPSDRVLQLTTPEFGALLKREWEYSKGEIGHLDYDPWLGGQDGEISKPFASPSRRSRRIRQLSPCHIHSCLTPSTRPNGTRCT